MQTSSKRILILSSEALFLLTVLGFFVMQADAGSLRVTFFDVGQGDSILIQTPSHQTILIDGGPDRSILGKLGRALPFYQRDIDLMILTHPHADHLIGLNQVLQRYTVHRVVYTDVTYPAPEYTEWPRLIEGSEVTIAYAGQQFTFGDVTLDVLFPLSSLAGESFDDVNDSSVVTRLVYQDHSFLFMGDAPVSVEEGLMAESPITLDSDYLKVGHHGSRYSSSADFLAVVSPDYAIIQSGEGNPFDHPHEITLRKLEAVGAEVLRNDHMGDIQVRCPAEGVCSSTP